LSRIPEKSVFCFALSSISRIAVWIFTGVFDISELLIGWIAVRILAGILNVTELAGIDAEIFIVVAGVLSENSGQSAQQRIGVVAGAGRIGRTVLADGILDLSKQKIERIHNGSLDKYFFRLVSIGSGTKGI